MGFSANLRRDDCAEDTILCLALGRFVDGLVLGLRHELSQ